MFKTETLILFTHEQFAKKLQDEENVQKNFPEPLQNYTYVMFESKAWMRTT